MEFMLTDEQKMVQATVREFVRKELIAREADMLRNERMGLPLLTDEEVKDLRRKARDAGFWGINTPEEYGGANLDMVMTTLINIELGKSIFPFTFGGEADNILYHCTEEQKQKYLIPVINGERRSCFALTEPGAGSDARNLKTRAVRDGNGWVINGEKIFITFGMVADFAMVFANTEYGVTCFLVDREMGWKSEPIHTMDGSHVASLVFDNVRVPEENILGEPGKAFELAMKWISNGRIRIAAWSVGTAERLLQMGLDHAKSRVAFGKPIADYQAIQWMLADSAVELEAARLLVLQAAYLHDKGLDRFRHHASAAKLYNANMVGRVVDRVLQIHGGMGITKELPIERWYRVVRKYRIYEGTDEILRRTIAQNLLKEYVKTGESYTS